MSDSQFIALVFMFLVGIFGVPIWQVIFDRKPYANIVAFGWAGFWCSPPLITLFVRGIVG